MEKKKKGIKLNPFIILFVVIVICAIFTHIVTPGVFERHIVDGKTVLDPNSYHTIAQKPVGIFDVFRSIPNGFVGSSAIMFLVMLVGGALEVYNKTGSLDKGISRILTLSNKVGSSVILVAIMIMFALIGGFLGWCEQIIPFVPLIVSICMALGYDSLVGVAASALVDLISFSVSPTNMFTVGIAHQIAELPLFSGMGLRLVILVVFNIVLMTYILIYANKVKKDPSKSLMKDVDTSSLRKDYSSVANEKMSTNQIIAIVVFILTFVVSIYSVIKRGWGLNEISAAFVFSGVVSGVICRLEAGQIVTSFIEGAKGSFNGALIIGLARGIQWTMEQGGLVDTLIHAISQPLGSLPTWATAIGVFLIITVVNALIPSGSGKAMAFMPILVPLADMIGITRQTMVLAYQFGDGISNTFWFTFGTLLIFLSLGKVPLKQWYKFVIPLEIIISIIACIFLVFATATGYGPF